MRRLAALLPLSFALSGCPDPFDHWYSLGYGTIAPGYSAEFSIHDGCSPQRDNFCEADRSVRIDSAVADDPSVVGVEIASSSSIRVTGLKLGRTTVNVRFVDNHGDDIDVHGVYAVSPGDQVVFSPICDISFAHQGSDPYPLPADREIEFTAQANYSGEGYEGGKVYGDGYRPWDAGTMTWVRDAGYPARMFYRTPALTGQHVVTSPIDPALAVPLAFFAPPELALVLTHTGNERIGDIVRIEVVAGVLGGGSPLCVDPFFRVATIETPETCHFSPDPASTRTEYTRLWAYSGTASGICRIRVALEGTTVSEVIEVPVEVTP